MPSKPKKDPNSKRWMITINNPTAREPPLTHDRIKEILSKLNVSYWCMGDEIGYKTQTYHTHLYLVRDTSKIRFSTLQNNLPGAHIEAARWPSEKCRDYVFKTGKWENSKKADTHLDNTDEEFGECPVEAQGYRSDLVGIWEMINEGMSDEEILEADPTIMIHLERLDKVRQTILEETYRNKWRNLKVTYIYGSSGIGKTRSVMEKYKDDDGNPLYEEVYRVTNYLHPFDFYHGEKVILFEEFRSSLRIQDMLNYLDGYPIKLPARFSDRQACYEEVYICTNIPLEKQYPKIQTDEPETWQAFKRRIHEVINMDTDENGFMKVPEEELPF